MTEAFSLVHRAWVPVVEAGRRREVSLLEALTRAQEFDRLALDDPLQAVAVLRQVLLPVALDALGAPRTEDDWARRWEQRRLDAAAVADYLGEHGDRFDLFHPAHPFAQVAGLRTAKDETKPVSLLLPAVPTGNNVPLFGVRTEADPPVLTPPRRPVPCWRPTAGTPPPSSRAPWATLTSRPARRRATRPGPSASSA